MKKTIFFFLVLLFGFSLFAIPAFSGKTLLSTPVSNANTSWSLTTPIPTSGVYSCVDSNGYIFCVGGMNYNQAYYAPESSSGISTWSSARSYPVISLTKPPACAVFSSYMYCEGGLGSGSNGPVYSASISSSGFGTWSSQNSYPISLYDNTCVTYSGYIYCVAGDNAGTAVSSAYYASISSGKVGTWTATTSYPKAEFQTSCVAITSNIICAEGHGQESNQALPYSSEATLSSSGISAWSPFAILPGAQLRGSCVGVSESVYCVGGKNIVDGGTLQNATFFTTTSTYPNWQTDVFWSRPFAPDMNGCVSDGTNIFCIGGYTNAAFTSTTNAVEYTTVSGLPETIKWNFQTPLPFPNGYGGGMVQSCAWSNNYLYCVQANGTAYYASAVNGVVGPWTESSNSYPVSFNVWPPTCLIGPNGDHIYCVGGSNAGNPGTPSNAVYGAEISPSGFGSWTRQANYPQNVLFPSCVEYGGYAYCVGGSTTFVGSDISYAYAAGLSSGTVGTWEPTTSYPTDIFGEGCAVLGSRIYCAAGETGAGGVVNAVYSAPLSTSPPYIGSWTQDTNFPIRQHVFDCVSSGVKVYCIGGNLLGANNGNLLASSLVYSTTNFASWNRETNLPYSTKFKATGECVSDTSGYIYCVGGEQWDNDTATPQAYYYTNQVVSANTQIGLRTTSSITSSSSSSTGTTASTSLSSDTRNSLSSTTSTSVTSSSQLYSSSSSTTNVAQSESISTSSPSSFITQGIPSRSNTTTSSSIHTRNISTYLELGLAIVIILCASLGYFLLRKREIT